MKILTTTLMISCLLLASCLVEEEMVPMESLYGKWQAISWLVKDVESGRDVAAVKFEFNRDSTYTATSGGSSETGVFRMAGNKLFTTAKGDAEKNVRLFPITADTMHMKMNRQGTIETLILVKQENQE